MKVGSKDATSVASFALLFVQNYVILELSDKISSGRWWIPKCSFFTALKSDNASRYFNLYGTSTSTLLGYGCTHTRLAVFVRTYIMNNANSRHVLSMFFKEFQAEFVLK